jgi:hypothetical protein
MMNIRRIATFSAFAVILFIASSVAPLGAQDIFRAQMLTGKAPVEPPLIRLQIEVNDWTTQEEVIQFQRILNEQGVDAFLAAYSQTEKGIVRFMYTRGFNLTIHAAIKIPTEKGEKILLFFNRQQWDSNYQRTRARHLFMAIELKLNQKGRGEGRFYEDAQIQLEPAEGTIVVEAYEGSPKIFPQVQRVVKKGDANK